MKKITPFLWFENQAEEAVNFYLSIFENSKIQATTRYGDAGPGPKGGVMVVSFELNGNDFVALNGNPQFPFTLATSFVVNCETQDEVDHYWNRLSEGGKTLQCGWLQDKYGVAWQIVPVALMQFMNDPDPVKQQRVMQSMMSMEKFDIAELQKAYAGEQ